MGKFLFIRVSVLDYDAKETKKNFPHLSQLAWSDDDKYIPASQSFGLLSLITSLSESLEFAKWTDEQKKLLADDIKELVALKGQVEKDVLDWKPQDANKLTFTIEEKLEELEKKQAEFSKNQ